jgi:hypothetical protein
MPDKFQNTKEGKMLTINISPLQRAIVTADGKRMSVYPTFIKHNGDFAVLNECADVGRVDRIKLLRGCRAKPSWKWRRIKLPQAVEKGVVFFLNRYHRKRVLKSDCYTFACSVIGFPSHCKYRVRMYWKLEPAAGAFRAGDTVFLMRGNVFKHAAICLGGRRYISVYGAGGQLEVSRLRDMIKDFDADKAFLATPRI